ncbi:MAG: hypothetical protein LBU05_05765 [Bifidobacteriaceae bacterium]|jgi:hypothetical protein|nr:hypothetical protein [Bifidobacteriaceae bacterium]
MPGVIAGQAKRGITMRVRLKAIKGCLLVVALAVVAAACAAKGDDVASIKQSAPAVSDASDSAAPEDAEVLAKQAASAQAMLKCLQDKAIEGELVAVGVTGWSQEFQSISPIPHSDDAAFGAASGGGQAGAKTPAEVMKKLDAGDQWVLYDNGQDLSAELVACVESAGYFELEPRFDQREEEVEKHKMVLAANEWIECAREKGWPDMVDVKAQIDNWETVPRAMVPGSATVDELKAVLAKYPPFDPERDLAAPNLITEGEEPPDSTDPLIGFELPEDDPKLAQLNQTLQDHITAAYEAAKP